MRHKKAPLLGLLLCLLLWGLPAEAQRPKTASKPAAKTESKASPDLAKYKDEIEKLIKYLEGTLNILGGNDYTVAEKNIIINETYLKLFRDGKVQIEDDLDPSREMVSNKDVQAYLKDIDIFFQEAAFTYALEGIEQGVTEEGEAYFTANTSRFIDARAVKDNKIVKERRERFIEFNLDRDTEELKIVSIYTTKLSRKDDMLIWWNGLTRPWKQLFGGRTILKDGILLGDVAQIQDTVMTLYTGERKPLDGSFFSQVERIMNMERLEVHDDSIRQLSPLTKLKELKYLNISDTEVEDLTPLRNLNKLEELLIEHTPVKDISPLRYCNNLKRLDMGHTGVSSLETVGNFLLLTHLSAHNTPVDDLTPLQGLEQLNSLKVGNSQVSDLTPLEDISTLQVLWLGHCPISTLAPLGKLSELRELDVAYTNIADIAPVSGMHKLRLLYIDSTSVSDLSPLYSIKGLEMVYCDNTKVTAAAALKLMQQLPNCLVIYGSEQLKGWWEALSPEWKRVFRGYVPVANPLSPSKEELQKIVNLKQLDISGNKSLKNLEPLKRLITLRSLMANDTDIEQLEPLKNSIFLEGLSLKGSKVTQLTALSELKALKELQLGETTVGDLYPLAALTQMERLGISGTSVKNLDALNNMNQLQQLDARNILVSADSIMLFGRDRDALIIFRGETLAGWWNGLSSHWKDILRKATGIKSENPNELELHRMAAITELNLRGDREVMTLSPASALFRLKHLNIGDTRISDISPLGVLKGLVSLDASNTPVRDFRPIAGMQTLKALDLSSTLVEKQDFLKGLHGLQSLKMSGNEKIRNLDEVAGMPELEVLEIFNTDVKSIKPLEGLKKLRSLRCYKTRIPVKKIQELRKLMPNCEIDYY